MSAASRRLSALGVGMALLLVATPAGAEIGGGTTAPSTIWAGVSVYEGSWRGSGSSCTWKPYLGDTGLEGQEGNHPVYKVVDGVTYQLYVKACSGTETLVWIPDLPPRSLSYHATSYLERLLPDPVPRFAPPAGRQVVKVGTWFWTSTSVWSSKSVTAWVPTSAGKRWATTTARPVRLVFDPGDGGWGTGPVSCTGPGSVWTSAVGDTAPSPAGCEYTYLHSSVRSANGVTFPGRLTIVWDVSWESSSGAHGYSGQLRTSAAVAMTVREIEALVVP